jgi:hypothetical protein
MIRGNNGRKPEPESIFFALQRADDIADRQLHQGS